MSKKRSTYPSHYYARQALPVKQPVVMEYQKPRYMAEDGEWIAIIIGAGVWGFALGMVAVAFMAGVV